MSFIYHLSFSVTLVGIVPSREKLNPFKSIFKLSVILNFLLWIAE